MRKETESAAGKRSGNGRGRMAAGAAAAVLLTLGWIAAVILILAGDGELLAREMLRHAPPERTGLPASEYAGVGRMTAEYLTDRRAIFQHEYVSGAGTVVRCFNAREQAHMADVRGLLRLARAVVFGALGTGLALMLWGMGLFSRPNVNCPDREAGSRQGDGSCCPPGREGSARQGDGSCCPPGQKNRPPVWETVWEDFRRGIRLGLLGLALLASGLAVWAILNFDGFFVTFHRLAFTNDLWLMDPRRDLIIRLMPTDFFVSLGGRGALMALPVPLALLGVGLIPRGPGRMRIR